MNIPSTLAKHPLRTIVGAALLSLASASQLSAITTFTPVSGDWLNAANWNNGIPNADAPGGRGVITGTSGGGMSVTLSGSSSLFAPASSGASLDIGTKNGQAATLTINAGATLTKQIVADTNTTNAIRIANGANTIGTLNVQGVLDLSGGGITAGLGGNNANGSIAVSGSGQIINVENVILSAGLTTIQSNLTLADQGKITGSIATVGREGTAKWAQTGGTAQFTNYYVGYANGSSGELDLSGGTVRATTLHMARVAGVTSKLTLSGSGVLQVRLWNSGAGVSNVDLKGGTLVALTSGTINTSLVNTGATFEHGLEGTTSTSRIQGSYTQGADATLSIDLASLTAYDVLRVRDGATLNGYLKISLLDGYLPEQGDTWDILVSTNGPITLSGLEITQGFSASVVSVGSDSILRLEAIPEPSAIGLVLLSGGAWLILRRRR